MNLHLAIRLSNSIFDTRYWELVSSLINTQDATTKTSELRPSNTWLTPLLHRIPLGPVLVSFLTAFSKVDEINQSKLAGLVSTCLITMWPIAVQRMPTETLQECFGALLCTLSSIQANDGIMAIGRAVSASYRNSLGNSSNKRKVILVHSFICRVFYRILFVYAAISIVFAVLSQTLDSKSCIKRNTR